MTALRGQTIKDAIRREVLAQLVVFGRGRASAVTGERLAELVRAGLVERGHQVQLAPRTLQRRCQEAIAELVEQGEQIASCSTTPPGYFIPETQEEFRDGAGSLRAHLASSARRLRAYDRATAEAILQLLGQELLPLPKPVPAAEPTPPPAPPPHQGPPVQLGLLSGRAA